MVEVGAQLGLPAGGPRGEGGKGRRPGGWGAASISLICLRPSWRSQERQADVLLISEL